MLWIRSPGHLGRGVQRIRRGRDYFGKGCETTAMRPEGSPGVKFLFFLKILDAFSFQSTLSIEFTVSMTLKMFHMSNFG